MNIERLRQRHQAANQQVSPADKPFAGRPQLNRYPCGDCKHATEIEAAHGSHYFRCGFVPAGPFAYWQYNVYTEAARLRHVANVVGPFTSDAEMMHCPAKDPLP